MSSATQRLQAATEKVADFESDEILTRFAELAAPGLCEHSELFFDSADEICTEAIAKQNVTAINQAKVELVDHFWLWAINVPVRHQAQDVTFTEDGHACIYTVFYSALARLQRAYLALRRPPLCDRCEVRESKEPYKTGQISVDLDGIVFGELGEDPRFG